MELDQPAPPPPTHSFQQHQDTHRNGPPQPLNLGAVNWASLLQNKEVHQIILSLNSLQVLMENTISADRAKLEEFQRTEDQRVHKENAEQLQSVRTPLEYGLVKNSNMDNLKKQRVFAQMQIDEFERNAKQQRENLRTQQQTLLQNAGVPGFYPTAAPDAIHVQKEIFNILTRIAQAQCP